MTVIIRLRVPEAEAARPRQPMTPTKEVLVEVEEVVPGTRSEVLAAPDLDDEFATSTATPPSRQLVAPPDPTPLPPILLDAQYHSLRTLGGLTRNDRLTRAWRSGFALRGWYFDQPGAVVVGAVPPPPAKITVWGFIVSGGQARWARRKTVYTKEVRLLSGPRVDFTFCSQCELRVFCLGISHALIPTETNATSQLVA
jgi:hypothetical protein